MASLRERLCVIADKSVVVSSKPRLAKRMAAMLRKQGILLQSARSARDLGGDTTAGGRRGVRVQKNRARLAAAVGRRVRTLARATKQRRKTQRLQRAAAVPKAVWGFQTKGVAPSTLKPLRAAMVRALVPRSPDGLSTTMVLHIAYGPLQDPSVFI